MEMALARPWSSPPVAAPAPLPVPAGGGIEALGQVMRALDAIRPTVTGSTFETTYEGRRIVLTPAESEQVRSATREALTVALRKIRDRMDTAAARYAGQEKTNEEFPVTSRLVKSWAWLHSIGRHENPGEAVASARATVEINTAMAQQALAAGLYTLALRCTAEADVASEQGHRLVAHYVGELIESGEGLVGGLEFTRNASFVTLGLLSVIATGGAAAGVAPGIIGTGVGGLSAGTTATVISVAAPIVAGLGEAGVRAAYGDSVDWQALAVDTAIQIIVARFGGKLQELAFGKLLGNPAAQPFVRRALGSLVAGVATHEVTQAFTVTVHTVHDLLRGRKTTWEQYLHTVTAQLTDPSGLFMAVVMSGVQVATHSYLDSRRTQLGQRLGRATGLTETERQTGELPSHLRSTPEQQRAIESKMAAQRRASAVKSLDDVPELRDVVMASKGTLGDGRTDLGELAATNPAELREYWAAWSAKQQAGKGKQGFLAYVRKRMSSNRGAYGEATDAFVRGAEEIMVVAPGRTNERGIDSVTFAADAWGGRIKLLDNKAVRSGSTVSKVTALQENLIKGNLGDVIQAAEVSARNRNAPREIRDVVLPRLRAAEKEISRHVSSWLKANPGRSLTDKGLQREIGKILADHAIDRVVTSAGGGPDVRISKELALQGFSQEL
ncbi:hypothetical protein [Streptomyces sp. Tu102]|uniref:hypothetical protein n=1 Tax=Streptomyces sp. Tu102 TaxID=2838019 RepID=UPI001BDCA190|nr:hypothetical protein [Streptomyces sp. Tu102]MBT1090328.1 hypothetical protein [Streptomyces sp. Tu102]